jgi:uncharacterized protein
MQSTEAIRHFGKMLKNLDQWLEKAKEHAAAKKFEVDVLAAARLAPDAYELTRQVQAACDQAKYAAAYLGGKPAPSHPDTEKTFADLRQRIEKCLLFIESVRDADLAGGAERKVAPAWLGGKWFRGADYLDELAIPNFYFHATMVYAILRHNGVPLGKMDYIGSITTHDA